MGIPQYIEPAFSMVPTGSIEDWEAWKAFCKANEEKIMKYRQTGDEKYKKALGCYTPSSTVAPNCKRSEATAVPRINSRGCTPLGMDMDMKNGGDQSVVEAFIKDVLALHDAGQITIDYLAISCSGTGVHLIYDEFQGHDDWEIFEHHEEVMRLLGNKYDQYLDRTVRHLSHLFFVERLEDIRFVDIKNFLNC